MFFLLSCSVQAQGPAWWLTRGAIDANLPPDDYALITQGQLKWMATNACAEMEAYFGAGSTITALIATFSGTNNYCYANLGQVKYVAQPFYDRLYDLNLTNTFPANMPGYYPWSNSSTTNDYAPANIGQVKYVFSFDSAKDSDGDGLLDWQEIGYGTDLYGPDTDGDGLSDGWEVAYDTDPLVSDTDDVIKLVKREEARRLIVSHWRMVYNTSIVFTNVPGSPADMDDMKDALNALSGKFYKKN